MLRNRVREVEGQLTGIGGGGGGGGKVESYKACWVIIIENEKKL